jgi:hypothetical protein
VASVKVRRRMVIVEHRDHDAIEGADGGQGADPTTSWLLPRRPSVPSAESAVDSSQTVRAGGLAGMRRAVTRVGQLREKTHAGQVSRAGLPPSRAVSFAGDLRKLRRELTQQGWRIEKRREYWIFWPADRTQAPRRIAGTPSSQRSWRNLLACLKRKGYQPSR